MSAPEEQACDVPLIEQLRSVPSTARQVIDVGQFESRNIPYGRLCHRAAEEIAALRARLAEVERERDEAREREAKYFRELTTIKADAQGHNAAINLAERVQLRDDNARLRDELKIHQGWIDHHADQARRLREDKERLDWLDRNAFIRNRTLALMERDGETLRWAGVEWDGRDETVRQSIDEARAALAQTEDKP